MRKMFSGCNELEFLDLSEFNTANVTDMEGMFNKCNKLKEIKGISNFNTSKVTKMNSMFKLCNALEYLDLSNYYTHNVKRIDTVFGGCDKLKQIKGLKHFDTSNVINMNRMFIGCFEII